MQGVIVSSDYRTLEMSLKVNYSKYYDRHLRSDEKKQVLYIHNSFSLGFGPSRKQKRQEKRKFGCECFVSMYEQIVYCKFGTVFKQITEKEKSFIRLFINSITSLYRMHSITVQEALFLIVDIKGMNVSKMSRYIQRLMMQRNNRGISGLEHRQSVVDFFTSNYPKFVKNKHVPLASMSSKVELVFDHSNKQHVRSDSVISEVDFKDYGELKVINNPDSKYHGQYETIEALAANHRKWLESAEEDRVIKPTRVYRGMDSKSILEKITEQGGLWHNDEKYRKGESFNPYNLFHHDRMGYLSLFFGRFGASYSMGMSTTTDITIAKNYAGKDGVVLEIILEYRNMAFYLSNCPELKEINVARRIAPRQIVAVWHYDTNYSRWVRVESYWTGKALSDMISIEV
ncbi:MULTISPECIES: hypothetical protein [Cysteiniphilum]|uniref:Uncharacterized protein n=1 Tax=Cysteiniphilum litorale TaxID=2056700 RepID=A0A8J2Z4K4_9GAMM|nr:MULTISPECIES: hypothetical protein [Cysteiniphilum]GGF98525.1 hypothetical protein GCM10010995_14730 [Cysteiniphilum litorale]